LLPEARQSAEFFETLPGKGKNYSHIRKTRADSRASIWGINIKQVRVPKKLHKLALPSFRAMMVNIMITYDHNCSFWGASGVDIHLQILAGLHMKLTWGKQQ
jgi:hypothetical protein